MQAEVVPYPMTRITSPDALGWVTTTAPALESDMYTGAPMVRVGNAAMQTKLPANATGTGLPEVIPAVRTIPIMLVLVVDELASALNQFPDEFK